MGELLAAARALERAFCSGVMPTATGLRGIEINGGMASFGNGGRGECREVGTGERIGASGGVWGSILENLDLPLPGVSGRSVEAMFNIGQRKGT